MAFTDCDEGNGVKAATHGALFTLSALCAIYNVAAWITRDHKEPHLAVNAIVYVALCGYELRNVTHHLRPRELVRREGNPA